MQNFLVNRILDKNNEEEKELFNSPRKLKYIWLSASQPKKTFSIEDIIDKIMTSGIMIHEKEFKSMMSQNSFRKTGIPFLNNDGEENYDYKNKYMNNDFKYL